MSDSTRQVEHQLRMVEIKRELERLGRRAAPVSIGNVLYGPCILISRESGSSGDEIAQRLGERLQWQVFHQQIVLEIAERAHVRNQLVESVDEHVRSAWQRLLHPIRERGGFTPENYLYFLHEIVLTLVHHGDVVIVGRGAQFLVPPECALRVRVVEPIESRARRAALIRNLPLDQAFDFVRKREAERTEFIRKLFHQDTASPFNYDLLFNTGSISVEAAVSAILAALESKFGVRAGPAACAT